MVRMFQADAGPATRMRTSPLPVPRTTRPLVFRNLTSCNAGLMVPLLAAPLLREDAMTGMFRFQFKMDETVEILMNSVNVRVMAYLVPKLAFDRYSGFDALNKSYEGISPDGVAAPVPWFETIPAGAPDATTNGILWHLGKHAKPGTMINTDYIEAYNQIWNYRATNRSPHLVLRGRLDTTLAPAFWNHQAWAHVVPDFDQAIIDGQVPLNVVAGALPVRSGNVPNNEMMVRPYSGSPAPLFAIGTDAGKYLTGAGGNPATQWNSAPTGPGAANWDDPNLRGVLDGVFAEMVDNGITVSLSNIEMARKTQAFANLRRQYNGYSDDYIIDLLMGGIGIPDESWKHPMLLSDESTIFGMAKRWATDGASLTESVVNGATFIDMRVRVPRCGPGGVVMIVAEIAPEQLFERQRDPYMHATTPSDLPQYLRDELDPEKVQIVQNGEVDVMHATPAGTFGYAPMNHQWAKSYPQVGGRFTRPADDVSFDEARQRIWAVETTDPVLGRDFYLVSSMNYKPFVVTDEALDHFEVMTQGQAMIQGNTVFGDLLIESTDDYEKVMAEADQSRIDKPAAVDAGLPSTD